MKCLKVQTISNATKVSRHAEFGVHKQSNISDLFAYYELARIEKQRKALAGVG